MRKIFLTLLLAGLAAVPCASQGPLIQTRGQDGRQMPPGENVIGRVTAVSKDSLSVAPMTGGDPVNVKISESTRVNKDRQPIKMDEVKVGDMVFVRGKLAGSSMDAFMVSVINPETVQRFQMGGGPGAGFNREDLGKKFIAGEVKAINELKLTIARPDNQTQEIEVDENTSFKKGRESITLADIKPGDFVRGAGELKNGVFVPKELIVGRPQMMMRTMGGGPAAASDDKKPGTDKPAANAPPKN